MQVRLKNGLYWCVDGVNWIMIIRTSLYPIISVDIANKTIIFEVRGDNYIVPNVEVITAPQEGE